MTQLRVAAATVVSAILSCGVTAHAQTFACGSVGLGDADPPLDAELLPTADGAHCTPPANTPCTHCLPFVATEVSEDELEAVLVGGAAAAALGYLAANILVAMQPHRTGMVDGIPVFGAVWSVAHNEANDRTTPLLLFSAGVQAIGILVTVAAATELHDLRKLNIDLSACATGAGATITWHY
jgi:hypothetical protein